MPHSSKRSVLRCGFMIGGVLLPAPLSGQDSDQARRIDSAQVARATLQTWDEQLRLIILDRGGNYFGRTSDRGILQRFNAIADDEYELDLISYGFSLLEDYEWFQRGQGARYWGGSINKLRVVQEATVAAAVDLSPTWTADVRINHQATLQGNRSTVRLGARKSLWAGRAHVFGTGVISALKPESDVEIGVLLHPREGTRITVALAALDVFNDLIYETLGVGTGVSDSTLSYTTQPFAPRLAVDTRIGPFRFEAYALAVTPTTLVVERQSMPGEGFAQDERFAYAGGLGEWEPSGSTAVGGFATWVRARTHRRPLELGAPEDAFDLTEATTQLGVHGIHLFQDFAAEAWMARVWRTEDRLRPDTTVAAMLDYEDRAWVGRSQVTYRPSTGFRAGVGLEFTARQVVGEDRMPSRRDLHKNNFRLRLELGWAFDRKAAVFAGAGFELDSDLRAPSEGTFDGGHARCVLYF